MSLYQIKDWNEHFENSKSRERISCSFVCVPNKQHGLSFSRLMAEKDGAMIYGIWCLLLGACSQQKKPREGWLTVDGYQTGTAWVPDDMALKFRRPKSEIERALQVISSQEVGWLIAHECPSSTRSVPAECPLGIGKEEKEVNRKKEEVASLPAPTLTTKQLAAKEVIDYLNLKTGGTLPHHISVLQPIAFRLGQNYTVADCKLVIDSKVAEWSKKPDLVNRLVPSTLFGEKGKFLEYISNAKKSAISAKPVIRESYEELKARGVVR